METTIENNIRRQAKFDVHHFLGEHLGSRYKEYRLAWNAAGPLQIPPFPIHLDLELADRCNKKCSFCPRDLEHHPGFEGLIGTNEVLDAAVIEQIARECAENNLYSINFGAGNEPLMCPNLMDVLEMFHDGGVVDSWIITNGVLLDKWIDRILESRLVNLYVSIDGYSEETYRKLRGEGFHRVCSAVEELVRRRNEMGRLLPLVRVSYIEHPDNMHESADFLKYWQNKVDFVDMQTFFDYQNIQPDPSRPRKRDCLDPYRRLAVHGNGSTIPCSSDFGLRLHLGDGRQQSLKEIWNGEAMGNVRRHLAENSDNMCNHCQTM